NHEIEFLFGRVRLRLAKGAGALDSVVAPSQNRFDGFEHRFVGIGEQNVPPTTGRHLSALIGIADSCRRLKWQLNGERRALRLNVAYSNRSAVFGHDAIANAQTKASPLTH